MLLFIILFIHSEYSDAFMLRWFTKLGNFRKKLVMNWTFHCEMTILFLVSQWFHFFLLQKHLSKESSSNIYTYLNPRQGKRSLFLAGNCCQDCIEDKLYALYCLLTARCHLIPCLLHFDFPTPGVLCHVALDSTKSSFISALNIQLQSITVKLEVLHVFSLWW